MRFAVAFALLIAGVVIYLMLRDDVLFLSASVGITVGYASGAIDPNNAMHYFVAYCLPDGLWFAALLLAQSALRSDTVFDRIIFAICVGSPFILELLQLTGAIPGTFDWWDIATYCVTLIIILLTT